MEQKTFYIPTDKTDAWVRLYGLICSLRETTLTVDRTEWFSNMLVEFRYLLNIANSYTFSQYQALVIEHGADDFNEAQLYFAGVNIINPQLHYAA